MFVIVKFRLSLNSKSKTRMHANCTHHLSYLYAKQIFYATAFMCVITFPFTNKNVRYSSRHIHDRPTYFLVTYLMLITTLEIMTSHAHKRITLISGLPNPIKWCSLELIIMEGKYLCVSGSSYKRGDTHPLSL